MRNCRTLAIALLAATVSACSTIRDPEPPQVRTVMVDKPVPAEARKPCERPTRLPDRDLKQAEVTSHWARDRQALVVCEQRRRAAAQYFEARSD